MRRQLLNDVSAVLEESADVTKGSSKARPQPYRGPYSSRNADSGLEGRDNGRSFMHLE